MSIHEECGVFGVFAEKLINAANICYYGLYALQHRGQESKYSAGIHFLPFPKAQWPLHIHVMERPVEQTGITASRSK